MRYSLEKKMKTLIRVSAVLILLVLAVLIVVFMRFGPLKKIKGIGYLDPNSMWSISKQLERMELYASYKKFLGLDLSKKIDAHMYYINLDRDLRRRNVFLKQMRYLHHIDFTRVPGVEGSKIGLKRGTIEGHTYVNHFDDLSHSELGCTLSHIMAIKTAFKDGRDIALIIEDDALFSLIPFWDLTLREACARAPEDWEMISLFNCHGELGTDAEFIPHSIWRPLKSTLAYLINRKGMYNIIHSVISNDETVLLSPQFCAKGVADEYIYAFGNMYYMSRPLLIPAAGMVSSSIHESHTLSHKTRTRDVLNFYRSYNSAVIMPEKQIKFATALHDMAEYLESIGVPYRLSSGTLLGAVRQSSFITYDHDIDLEVLAGDYKSRIEIGTTGINLLHTYGKPDFGYEMTFRHKNGINIDIFIVYDENDYRWFSVYGGRCDLARYGTCRLKLPKVNEESLSFMGREFPVPADPVETLVASYGLNWNIPIKYNFHDGLTSANHQIIEEDFPVSLRLEKPTETKKSGLWHRKVSAATKPIIWMYWQNMPSSKKPAYLDLCLETIHRQCGDSFEIIVLDDESVPAVLPDIHPKFTNIYPLGMRADYVRFCLLAEHGGIWLDSDVIVQKDLSFLIEDLKKHSFVGFEHEDESISIGFLAANKGNRYCKFMKILFENQFSEWTKRRCEVPWAAPTHAAESFFKGLRAAYPKEVKTYPASMVYPIDWKVSNEYYWGEGTVEAAIFDLPVILLHNEMYSRESKMMSRSEVLGGPSRMSHLLRRALA